MKFKKLPSQKIIREALDYDPVSGVFTWKMRADRSKNWNSKFSGKVAGTLTNKKGVIIFLNNVPYFAHRLAWVFVHGNTLEEGGIVDHKNCDPHQNYIANLRVATHDQNGSNSRGWKKKKLPKGVSTQTKSHGYRARIGICGDVRHLGTFSTPEEAHHTYMQAALAYKGEFARAS